MFDLICFLKYIYVEACGYLAVIRVNIQLFHFKITNIIYNDAKRRVYGRDLAKKQKCSVPCSVLFSSRYIDGKKIFRQRFVSGSG